MNQTTTLVRPDVALLLSPVSSASTLAVSKTVSAKEKLPLCVSISAADEITMKNFQPYVMSTAPTTYMLMQAVTARLAKRHYQRYAILVPDYAGGRASSVRFKELIKQLDPKAEIVVEE